MKSETRNDVADSYATLKTLHFSQPSLYKVIKIGEIVKVMDDGYYGCYDVISVKDHIKATTICLEEIKEPDV